MRTVVPGGLEDAHTFFNCGPGISFIVRRINGGQKGNVDTEGFVRASPSLTDSLPQRFGAGLGQRRKHTCGGMSTVRSYDRDSVPSNIPRPPAFETAAASEGSPTLE